MTAKLSRRFYEQFGDEVTNELVDWFNAVDASFQASLKEQNEANFARLEERLERRFGEVLSHFDRKIVELSGKIDQVINRMGQFEDRLDRLTSEIATIRVDQARFEARLLQWTVGLWTSTMLAFLALTVAVLRSR